MFYTRIIKEVRNIFTNILKRWNVNEYCSSCRINSSGNSKYLHLFEISFHCLRIILQSVGYNTLPNGQIFYYLCGSNYVYFEFHGNIIFEVFVRASFVSNGISSNEDIIYIKTYLYSSKEIDERERRKIAMKIEMCKEKEKDKNNRRRMWAVGIVRFRFRWKKRGEKHFIALALLEDARQRHGL